MEGGMGYQRLNDGCDLVRWVAVVYILRWMNVDYQIVISLFDGAEWSRTVVVEVSSIDAEYQHQYLLFGMKCLLSEGLNLFFQLEDVGCAEIVVRY